MNYKTKIKRKVGTAINDFKMIAEGDRILICLSGGKDSWVMLDILTLLQKKAPVRFEIEALKVDYPHNHQDNTIIKDNAERRYSVKCTILETNTENVIDSVKDKSKSHCALCSRLRRGVIYTYAHKHGFNKIALGHHMNDTNETLIMNLFFSGTMKGMAPILESDDKRNIIIRPLIYVKESWIVAYAEQLELPLFRDECRFYDQKERSRVKLLLNNLEKEIPDIQNNILAGQGNLALSHLLDKSKYKFPE